MVISTFISLLGNMNSNPSHCQLNFHLPKRVNVECIVCECAAEPLVSIC